MSAKQQQATAVVVTLPDGSRREFPAGTTVREVAQQISPGLARRALLARVDGSEVDLSHRLESDAALRLLTAEDPEALYVFRHSSAHLLAAAVLELFPEAKCGNGPPTEEGFFYDFAMPRPFTPEDLEKIEKRMLDLVKQDLPYERVEIPKEEALRRFRELGQDFKVELVEEKGEDVVSCYRLGSFFDFCRGPHIPSTGRIRALKVLGSSGAHWKGDEANAPLQRVHATSFFDPRQLEEHLQRIEEAKRRDHRRLGRELSLFRIEPEAPGQVFWLPNGLGIVNRLVDYMREKLEKRGYQEIRTPLILDVDVWRVSGHLDHYRENMFFVEAEEASFGLKPMNCPGAAIVYRSELRSYRDLPLRLAEFGHCHRYERSGVLSGLTRVRAFVQDDAHIYCTPDQVEDEVVDLIDLVVEVYGELGFEKVGVELSTRPESAIGTAEQWEHAERALQQALARREDRIGAYRAHPGEGAFYGPKIDFHVEDAIGRSHQCATIQVDPFQAERFDLHYAAEDGTRPRPVAIHRAILGSIERFMAVLIEHTGGAFPVWLAPVQAIVLPIAERHHDYAREVTRFLRERGFRVKLDDRSQKTGYKVREAQVQKIPFMLVVGDREVESGTLSVRNRFAGDQGPASRERFAETLDRLVRERAVRP